MFCVQCGNNLPDHATFCTKCGASQNKNAVAATPPLKFNLGAFTKFVLALQLVVVILAFAAGAIGRDHNLGKSVGSLVLGIQGPIATLCLIFGFIVGIVFFIQASSLVGPAKSRKKQLGMLALFGPIVWWVCIVIAYIILNVAQQLLVR